MKNYKKLTAILMLVSFIFATVSPAMAAGLADITSIAGGKGGTTGNAGTIYFGNYWQSYSGSGATDVKESYNYEGIKWRVLSNDQTGTGTKQVFLMSDQGLYADQFNSNTNMGNVWKDSEVRATLTGLASGAASNTVEYADLNTASFAKDAFSAEEYAAIADTTHGRRTLYRQRHRIHRQNFPVEQRRSNEHKLRLYGRHAKRNDRDRHGEACENVRQRFGGLR